MTNDSKSAQTSTMQDMVCPKCGSVHMRRLPRQGFLQKHFYPRLGYFPWECPICRKIMMLKHRGKRRRRTSTGE